MNTTQAVVKPSTALKQMLDHPDVAKEFKRALGENMAPFIASLIDLYTQDKQLQECPPKLVVAEALRAAALNLPIIKSLGYAYIVVFKNNVKQPDGTWVKVATPTFVLGTKGYNQLALRSGQYRTINADVVYEGEMSRTNKLTGEIVIDPDNRKSDKVVGYFAHFELINGFSKTLFMSLEEMAKYAKRFSKSIPKEVTWEQLYEKGLNNVTGTKVGWMDNFEAMALKTVLRRLLSKWGYLSIQMQNAIANDDETEPQNDRESILEAARGETQTINLDSSMYSEVQPIPSQTPAAEEDDDEDTSMATPQF